MTNHTTDSRENDLNGMLYKAFPYESLCCNGDYCKAGCDDTTRKEILGLLKEAYTRGRRDAVEKIWSRRKEFAYPNFVASDEWDEKSDNREWCFCPDELKKVLDAVQEGEDNKTV